jgi:hypothetical protein
MAHGARRDVMRVTLLSMANHVMTSNHMFSAIPTETLNIVFNVIWGALCHHGNLF